jgi:hypothetical protein
MRNRKRGIVRAEKRKVHEENFKGNKVSPGGGKRTTIEFNPEYQDPYVFSRGILNGVDFHPIS